MAHLIDKDALIAEIENRIKELQNFYKENEDLKTAILLCIDECKVILSLLDTLEVKEVDLESEWAKYFENRGNMATVNIKHLAKHFFELGLKAQKGENNYHG